MAEPTRTPEPSAAPDPAPGHRAIFAAVVAVGVGAIAVWGWWTFWFLCDDAFIGFRYVSNAIAGRGWVWNPPPFQPVEGYSNFLWLVLLKWIWQLAGIEPPDAANVLALVLGLGTLGLGWRLGGRWVLPAAWERHRAPWLFLALLGTVTNRTFLAWLSSGLETSLFQFLVTWWLCESFAPAARRGAGWVVRLASAATLLELTRPDGMLFVLSTGLVVVAEGWRQRRQRAYLLAASPLLGVAAHLLWRVRTYGDWVPNTYYAKHVRPWPESGLRYLACFVLEYAVWVWLALALGAGLGWLRTRAAAAAAPTGDTRAIPPEGARQPVLERAPGWIAIATLVAHLAYYVLDIGGDHFEYRVLSHLVLLLFVSAVALATRVARRPAAVYGWLLAFVLLSYPIPWTHWWGTKDLRTRRQTEFLVHPIADHFPFPIRGAVAAWDRWQKWLIEHRVGMRHQEHKVFLLWMAETNISRAEGQRMGWEPYRPVGYLATVGYIGWVFPHLALIDQFGLTDRVVGRTPVTVANEQRSMAHDRTPPPGYIECFRPNIVRVPNTGPGRVASAVSEVPAVVPRAQPLSDAEIRACETRHWPAAGAPPEPPDAAGAAPR